ncbi:MAG: NAD+ synthase, partial [Planctomycetes bacterium]|nr:NAD+ synthase [Planctomycetota bacterium]
MRVALAQINPRIADLERNAAKIRAAIQAATDAGAQLIVFSELASIGYLPLDLLERRHLVEAQWQMVQEIAADCNIPCLLGCVQPMDEGPSPRVRNAAVFIDRGVIQAVYHKQLLPNYDVFDERRYFYPGSESLIIEVAGKKIGVCICEDMWTEEFSGWEYDKDPLAAYKGQCDYVVSLSASPYSAIKPRKRVQLLQSVAQDIAAPLIYVNQVAAQDELLFDGGSCVIGAHGEYYAQAKRWQEDLCIADLSQPIERPTDPDPLHEMYEGLCFGVRDYCEKTGQQSVVLGLSGGIDSALVAAIACDALGPDKVHGLLMPSPYSSQHSIDDAVALAKNLGMKYHTCNISDAFAVVNEAMSEVFAGTEPNVAEENMQARIRGTLIMAYANKFNAMALTTGNKSEMAVGYCTIYGDMNGGLAVIADVYKTTVWELSRYVNRRSERIPHNSIEKPPSAELRPDQVDTDSLPPYEILDAILLDYIETQLSAEAIIAKGFDAAVVHKMCRLVEINEYKRR